MDFSEQLADQKSEEDVRSSEGASLLQQEQESEYLEEEKRQNGKFQSAFDGSGLNNDGPPTDKYDYQAEFNRGNSFKSDDNGGVNLSNENVEETAVDVGGFDLRTGKRYTGRWADPDKRIEEGVLQLQKSYVNTKAGAPPDDMLPLSSIGFGILSEGGTYEDFVTSTQGVPWTDEQRAISWESAKQAKQTTEDVRDYGSRIWNETVAENIPDVKLPIKEAIDESELKTDAGWIQSGTVVLEAFTPGSTTGMTQEEINNASLELMSDFNWNIPNMMSMTAQIVNSKDPELAKSFLHLMKQNDATNVNWDNTGRALTSTLTDFTVWATFGGSVLVSRMAGAAMRAGVRKLLTKAATVTALDTAMGATAGAVTDISRQTIEGNAGERKELDTSEVAKAAAISGGVTTVLGMGSAVVADPALRKFGIGAMRKGAANLRGGKPRPVGGPQAQLGAVGASRTPKQVEFRSRLDENMDSAFGKKANIKVETLQNTVKSWIKKGLVKQEEIDWAGINMLDPKSSVNREEIRAFVDFNRPVPQLNPVAEVRHERLSLGNPEGGYREVIITVDKTRTYTGKMDHFDQPTLPPAQPPETANVGHMRLTTTKASGRRGTMLLEGQSDIASVRHSNTYPQTAVGKKIRDNSLDRAVDQAKGAVTKATKEYEDYAIKMMEKYRVDPTTQHGDISVWSEMSDSELKQMNLLMDKEMKASSSLEMAKRALKFKEPIIQPDVPFTPFRGKKQSQELLFRSAVMDAMNDGSEFLSWPASYEQIRTIEQWPAKIRVDSVVDFYAKKLPKIAKAYGFKVEEYVPDELPNEGKFFRIVFSPEDKKKWREGGAAMYGFGAATASGAIHNQNRDEQGRFK